ncbi:Nocturnin [Nowakowskiella sp. JEL0407]|nr:Nocturnin [Nowakowskiella sp. JEL0407]
MLLDRKYIEINNQPDESIPDISSLTVSIFQWNTLASSLSNPEAFPFVNSEFLTPQHRIPLILSEISKACIDSDFITLQEVDSTDLKQKFQAKFEEFEFRVSSAFKERGDGIVLAVNKSWEVLDSLVVRFQKNYVLDPIILKNYEFTKELDAETIEKLKETSQIALIQIVRKSGLTVCIVTTHLKAKAKFETIRTFQINHLIAIIESTTKQYDDCAVFLAGDLNSCLPFQRKIPVDPGMGVYESLLDRGYKNAYVSEREIAWTTWKRRNPPEGENKHTIDYMLYKKSVETEVTPKKILWLPYEGFIDSTNLPNAHFPSDHLSLSAVFELSKK